MLVDSDRMSKAGFKHGDDSGAVVVWSCGGEWGERSPTSEGRVAGRRTGLSTLILLVSHDHEDGGPTIQLPAAEAAAPFRRLTVIQYTCLSDDARFAGKGEHKRRRLITATEGRVAPSQSDPSALVGWMTLFGIRTS